MVVRLDTIARKDAVKNITQSYKVLSKSVIKSMFATSYQGSSYLRVDE